MREAVPSEKGLVLTECVSALFKAKDNFLANTSFSFLGKMIAYWWPFTGKLGIAPPNVILIYVSLSICVRVRM